MKLKYIISDFLAQVEFDIKNFILKKFPYIVKNKYDLLDILNERTQKTNPANRLSCKVGRNTYCAKTVEVIHPATTIGSFCSISQNTMIGPGEHPLNYLSTSPCFYMNMFGWRNRICNFNPANPCTIGNDVWIGYGVFIKEGITVGDGAVIGAGSVVVKDVPPYAIVGGAPAKIIKYRFNEQTIKKLLELKWWDLDDEIIQKIPFENIDNAISFLEKIRSEQSA